MDSSTSGTNANASFDPSVVIQRVAEQARASPFSDDVLEWKGQTKTVLSILALVHQVTDTKMQDRAGAATAPSVHTLTASEARKGKVKLRRQDVGLFLTPEVLAMEVEVSTKLCSALAAFIDRPAVDMVYENVATINIIAPIVNIWLALWTDGKTVDLGPQWSAQPCQQGPSGGDTDICVLCAQEGGPTVKAAVLEAKTPRSCGHPDMIDYGEVVSLRTTAMARQVRYPILLETRATMTIFPM